MHTNQVGDKNPTSLLASKIRPSAEEKVNARRNTGSSLSNGCGCCFSSHQRAYAQELGPPYRAHPAVGGFWGTGGLPGPIFVSFFSIVSLCYLDLFGLCRSSSVFSSVSSPSSLFSVNGFGVAIVLATDGP